MSAMAKPGRSRLSETPLSGTHRALRAVWAIVYLTLFRPSPRPFHAWRRLLLRLFGARIGAAVRVYQTVKIWAPWNLEVQDRGCLGYYVDCYNCDKIVIEKDAVVSQYSILCTGTHDYTRKEFPLLTAPIVIGDKSWVCACAFIGPGVMVGEGAVVGARSCVLRDVAPWTVVAGNPATFLKSRNQVE